MANNSNTPTLKQKLFAKAYVKNKGNGAKAARESYNVSQRNSHNLAFQVLQKPVVQKEISQQLTEAGLGIEDLNNYTKQSIDHNLKFGKASQAVAASLIALSYKMHNAMPASKKLTMNLSLKDQVVNKDFDEVKKLLEKQTEVTQALLAEIKG